MRGCAGRSQPSALPAVLGGMQSRHALGWETLNFILRNYQKATSLKLKIFCSEVTAYNVLQRDMRKGRVFLSFVIGVDPLGP